MASDGKCDVLRKLYDWLDVSDPLQQVDAMFVLAGREGRKTFALRLLKEGWATKLLLSVGRYEIRRFRELKLPVSVDLQAIASTTEPRRRHYFVELDDDRAVVRKIAVGRLGTWSEIGAFSSWLKANHSVRSVMVVSSGFHLRRVRLCCRILAPEGTRLKFVAIPEESREFRDGWWRQAKMRDLVMAELLKIVVYRVLGRRLMTRGRSAAPLPAIGKWLPKIRNSLPGNYYSK